MRIWEIVEIRDKIRRDYVYLEATPREISVCFLEEGFASRRNCRQMISYMMETRFKWKPEHDDRRLMSPLLITSWVIE